MTGRDLENLSKVPVPQPRANAKKAALDAALQAFDAAGMSLPASSPACMSVVCSALSPPPFEHGSMRRPQMSSRFVGMGSSSDAAICITI